MTAGSNWRWRPAQLHQERPLSRSIIPTIEDILSEPPENASIGSAGAYTQRVYWIALGSYYDRVYRLTGTGQGRVALIDLELEQELGTN